MSYQTFLFSPKFNKKLIYKSPTNRYQKFTNAYVYSIMVKTGNSNPNRADICNEATQEWNKVKSKSMAEIDEIIRNFLSTPYNLYNMQIIRPSYTVHTRKDTTTPFPTIRSVDPIQEEIPANASAQKKIANEITVAEKKITEESSS
ncbi:uncharacterized protein OCT59_021655 [Rhizophagus irregularis]|uniref:uncharacterized protein n=1 Tax=Rhizophagus irregularis TaxID=588596 RepID=UPI003331A1FA|nr:hypothetical protein OCT59_021655 [Rhizophagus irregularis]